MNTLVKNMRKKVEELEDKIIEHRLKITDIYREIENLEELIDEQEDVNHKRWWLFSGATKNNPNNYVFIDSYETYDELIQAKKTIDCCWFDVYDNEKFSMDRI